MQVVVLFLNDRDDDPTADDPTKRLKLAGIWCYAAEPQVLLPFPKEI